MRQLSMSHSTSIDTQNSFVKSTSDTFNQGTAHASCDEMRSRKKSNSVKDTKDTYSEKYRDHNYHKLDKRNSNI